MWAPRVDRQGWMTMYMTLLQPEMMIMTSCEGAWSERFLQGRARLSVHL